MDFLRRLFGGGAATRPADESLLLYVRCSRCGAVVQIRVHPYNDLAVDYDEREEIAGYQLRKEIMDARCFRLMYADMAFDRNRRELSRNIEGGAFITREEFERAQAGGDDRQAAGHPSREPDA